MNSNGFDRALSTRAASGDTVALKLLLVESHQRLLARLALRIPARLRRALDPEDILQEAHVQVFRSIGSFEPRGENAFFRWVAAVALNGLRSAIRRERALKRGGNGRVVAGSSRKVDDSAVTLFDTLAARGRTPSRCVAREEAITAVKSALAELPEHYQQAVLLIHLEGRSAREAANQMGRTERAIHGLCRRGLKLLRQRMGRSSKYLSSTG